MQKVRRQGAAMTTPDRINKSAGENWMLVCFWGIWANGLVSLFISHRRYVLLNYEIPALQFAQGSDLSNLRWAKHARFVQWSGAYRIGEHKASWCPHALVSCEWLRYFDLKKWLNHENELSVGIIINEKCVHKCIFLVKDLGRHTTFWRKRFVLPCARQKVKIWYSLLPLILWLLFGIYIYANNNLSIPLAIMLVRSMILGSYWVC